MANEYKNKVVYGGNTLIDLTGDDVTVADVASGKKFHLPSGEPAVGTGSGGSSAIVVIDEQLPGGGVAKHITGVDISSDTVDAAHLAQGYTAHDSTGAAITGTMSGGPDINDINNCRRSGTAIIRDDFFSGVVIFEGINLFPYVCAGANKITEVHGPDITTLLQINAGGGNGNDNAHFIDCSALKVVDFPKLTKIGQYMFQRCTSLTSVHFPAVTSWTYDSLSNCSNLETAVFPSVTGTLDRVIRTCVKLSAVDIGNPQTISGNTFNGDSALKTLIIRRTSSNTSLSNINAFGNTPFASGGTGGTLYVPSALISSYQSATNWSTILGYTNNSIQAIEGSQYENYYADGTPIT